MDERREDWRQGVDENLASLNAGQRVWEREVGIILKQLDEADHLLRGDPDKDTDGVMARLHNLENDLALMRAIVLKDAAGGRGLVDRVAALESGERTAGDRWKFATAVIVAVISFAGLIVTNLDRIESAFTRKGKPDKLTEMIERAKRPKARPRHANVRELPPEQPEPDAEN